MTLLSTVNLSKSFAALNAVSNVNFELPEGQIRAIIGPNGAGKSTFVSLLCGRIRASSGQVFFNQQDVTALPAHERIAMGMAYTFQITSVFSTLSVRENVALAARRVIGSHRQQVNERVETTLEQLNLHNKANDIAGDMSYGHQRLLEIAMGVAQQPKLFILDEPTQGLAEDEIEAFNKLIKQLAKQATILLIEHNMNVVMACADYITVLDMGLVLAEGTPAEIRNNDAVQAAYLGTQ